MSDDDPTYQPDLSQIFSWHSHYSEKTRPHDVRVDRTGRFAVIVLRRGQSRANGDFGVNMNLLTSAAAAVRDGKYSMAYVAQVKQQTVLRTESVETVIKNIGDAEAHDGVFGPYFWLDEHFMPVGFKSGGVSPYDPNVF
jgi:hypothetical protein